MKLVIAEKPSVAQSLAKVIGATKCQDGYLEGKSHIPPGILQRFWESVKVLLMN